MNQNNAHILNIKKDSIISDIAMDFLPEVEMPSMWEVLDRYHQSGFHFLNIALAGEMTSIDATIRYVSRQRAKIQKQSDKFIIVNKVDDILKAKKCIDSDLFRPPYGRITR